MRVQNDFWKCLVLFSVIQTISKCAELSVTTPKLNLKAINATKDSLTISWDVTANPASRFQVCWGIKQLGKFPEDCANATELPGEHVIKELSPCQWYTVSVEARDENSDPLVTEEIIYFTDGGNSEPPGVSESLKLGSRSNEIGALWTERGEHNGTCIYSLTLCWKKIDGLEEGCRVSLAYQELIIKDLEHCTNYTVTTYTSSIEGLKSTNKTWHQFTGPGEIENLTLTSLGPDSIAVKWEPPTKGWSCASLVNIISYKTSQNKQNVTVSPNETEYVFHNLEPCNNQHVSIRVISEEGGTSRNIWGEGYTAANAPGQVEDFKVFETKSHSLHVTWSPPSENEQCLFKYSVCWRETGKTQQRCERQGLRLYPDHSIYGLQSCTEYIVTVASMGSTKIIGNTTGLTVFTGPEPVTALKVDNVDTRSVTVSWDSPTCAQQFSVCWGAWQDKGGHSCTSVTNTSYTVSGLEPGNNYTIMVAALGNTGAQSDVRVVTASVTQEPPKELVVKNYTGDSVTVVWSVSLDQPTTELARVCWKLSNDYGDGTCSNTAFSGQEYTISDLEPCHWYRVTIFTPGDEEKEYASVEQFTDDFNNEQPRGVKNLSTEYLDYESFRVKWDNINGSCASHLLVCWEQSQVKGNGCQLIPSYETSFYKEDLNVCTNVTVSVSAVSVDGLSSGNESITITTGPGRVQNLTSWVVELGSIGLKWDPPLPGEDCVSHYIVGTRNERFHVKSTNMTEGKLEHILSNLTHCKVQLLYIEAANQQDALSERSYKLTTSGAGAPGEVTEPKVAQTGSHSLHLEWKRPLELFDCLVMYSVCWKKTNGTDSACAEQKLEQYPRHNLYGLKSCTEYTVTLATLGVGKLHDNDTTLTQFTGPEPVTALKVDNVDTRSVTVSWESPTCTQQFSVCWGAWQDKGGHSCTSVTNTSYTVSGLEPGNNYTVIVAALGNTGAQSDVRVVTASVAQEPPKELVVKNYTGDSVTVVWSVSLDQPTTELARVCWKLSNDYGDGTCSNTAFSGQEYTISDLEPCHWYRVTIFTPGDEEKEYASVEQFTDDFNNEQPRGVKNLSTAFLDYNSFRVKWDNINGSCASHLLVCWEQSQVKGNGCQLIPSYETSFYKEDLNVCTNVTVSVSAVSVDGLSSGNESITITTGPGRVQNLTSWVVELGSIGLKWDPPLPGEDCVSHYIVGTRNERFHVKSTNMTEGKLEHILSNLTHCKVQLLFIQAANQQNALSERSYKLNTSGAEAPGEVTEPKVAQTGSHSLHLEWKPPLELFDCLVMYSVCWKETNGSDSACAEQKLEQYPKHNLYGFKSCTEYTVTLATLGVGKLHDNDTTLTQFTGPEPVTALKVDNVDTRSVTVSWESPTCAQQFSVCWGAWQDKGGHSCTSVTNTSYTVSGLEPGNNYTIIVAALGVNEAQSDLNIVTVQLPPEIK